MKCAAAHGGLCAHSVGAVPGVGVGGEGPLLQQQAKQQDPSSFCALTAAHKSSAHRMVHIEHAHAHARMPSSSHGNVHTGPPEPKRPKPPAPRLILPHLARRRVCPRTAAVTAAAAITVCGLCGHRGSDRQQRDGQQHEGGGAGLSGFTVGTVKEGGVRGVWGGVWRGMWGGKRGHLHTHTMLARWQQQVACNHGCAVR